MNGIWNWLYVAAAVVLLFGAAVFVHEWGHYFMALRRKLKVEAFAIGFGPKIFSWRKNGIDYSWRWIPAGGFVRIPQMVTSEALEGKQKGGEPIPPADPVSKILVAFAGPFMNLVFAFVIASVLYFVGLPVLMDPSIIGYVDPQSAEGKLGIREADRVVMVDGRETRSWHEVQEATVFATTNILPVVIERVSDGNTERKTYHLEAKGNEMIGGKYLNLDSKDHPEASDVFDGPAKQGGVQPKDVIVRFAGVNISGVKQLQNLIKERGGQSTEMEVERAGKRVTLTVTPKGEKGTGLLGVALGSSSENVYEVQKPGPKPWDAISEVVGKTFATLNAVFFQSKKTGVGPKDLSGPIGIFALLASQVNVDYRLALNFLVLLNVNLAILNLLPLPVLDGGHILLALIEGVIRRPLPAKIQEYATTAFAVLLISFMVFVSFHDIKRFRLFRSMFQQENRIEQQGTTRPEPSIGAPQAEPVPSNK
jgi:regulator of sigma E protease